MHRSISASRSIRLLIAILTALSLGISVMGVAPALAQSADTDGDGVLDDHPDLCAETPEGETPDENGCSPSQLDTDQDGVNDDLDDCPDTPAEETADETGCSTSQLDTDNDGVSDDLDDCADTPGDETADENGCSPSQLEVADADCTFVDGVLSVALGADASVTLGVSDGTIEVSVNDVACGDDLGATTENTTAIDVSGTAGGDEELAVDLSGGPFQSSGGTDIALSTDLGSPETASETTLASVTSLDSDHLKIIGSNGGDDIVAGVDGITLDADDGDPPNLTYAGVESLGILGGGESDWLVAAGSLDTGAAVDLNLVSIFGEDGEDQIHGSDLADDLFGGNGADIIFGHGGRDLLVGNEGHDDLDGGDGADALWGGNNSSADSVGGEHDDTLSGGRGHDWLSGGLGNDHLAGNRGNDSLLGGPGDDFQLGGSHSDSFAEGDGPNGADYLSGDWGVDSIDYSARSGDVYVNQDGEANDGEDLSDPADGDASDEEDERDNVEGFEEVLLTVDTDDDGIDDDADNCPDTPNEDQADGDGDGAGDACEDGSPWTGSATLFGGGPGGSEWYTSRTSGCSSGTGVGFNDAQTDPDDVTPRGSQGDPFDGALIAQVGGSAFDDGSGYLEDDVLYTGPATLSGLAVTRQDAALQSSATMRTLLTFHNPTEDPIASTIEWWSNLGSDGSEAVRGTSDGDAAYEVGDAWAVSSDNASNPNDPALTYVLFGTGADVATSNILENFGDGCFGVDFDINVPAGETLSLLLFTQMNQTNTGALEAASSFDTVTADSDLVDGLSTDQLRAIANWSFDNDGDGIFDIDDPDDDNDGVDDDGDNCQYHANDGQEDGDEDGVGDACEDTDGDGRLDPVDNCPNAHNPGQQDSDEDGIGNRCDSDLDGDGVDNDTDNCRVIPNDDQTDSDNDGVGDACIDDYDGDETPDADDPCPHDAQDECTPAEDDYLQVLRMSTGHAGTLNVLANDGNNFGEGLTLTDHSDPAHGSVSCAPSGSCTYTADEDFPEGSDSFEYSIEDAHGGFSVGLVDVDVFDHGVCVGDEGACIENSLILLGVRPEGHLNVGGGPSSTWEGTDIVGLRYMPTGGDSTSPGCTCEGWGAADAISGVSGYANDSAGIWNVTGESFHATASDALSVANVGETLEVTHDFHPSPDTQNLYEVTVTLRNLTDASIDARYSRAMDWDIEPTAFEEFSTIFGGSSDSLLHSSANGFSNADPLRDFASDDSGYEIGSFTDAGPEDHGAVFDFGFGLLGAGEEVSFNIYYGAAGNEADAIDALIAVGAEVFSLGQPSTPDGASLGTPNTYIFGFSGVEGEEISDRPFAVTDHIVTGEGSGQINVLSNDIDFPFNEIELISWTNGALGDVHCETTGIDAGLCSYTGGPAYSSSDLFRYVIEDADGNRDTGAVQVSPPDSDGDGVADPLDNCLNEQNGDQADEDEDGQGNVCDDDSDSDNDGVVDASDNCVSIWNPIPEGEENQADANSDGQGDACEPDLDGDGKPDDPDESLTAEVEPGPSGDEDNCIGTFNPTQADFDGDKIGDACDDSDVDGETADPDGVVDALDNCVLLFNPDQVDADLDGEGAVCDEDDESAADPDWDGVPNSVDTCDNNWNPGIYQTADKDNDGLPDACDPVYDICPATILPNATFENPGFETGDLAGWKKGIQTEGVAISTGGGGFTTPYEGSFMARLGTAHGSYSEPQPIGPNALCQSFIVPEGTDPADLQRFFAFNVFTYDYKGYDSLRFEATLLNGDGTTETLASVISDSWGSGVSLKSTGWQVIELNLDDADRGKVVLLSFSAGGTSDQLYSTWAYIDSASGPEPSLSEVVAADVGTTTGSVSENPLTGDLTLQMPYGNKSDVTVPFNVTCPEGTTLATSPAPTVQLMNAGGATATYPLTHVGGTLWQLFIASTQLANGDLVLFATCEGGGGPVALQDTVMTIQLYDPSGIISDEVTGDPVVGATVTLYKMPNSWQPETVADGDPTTCQSNTTKPAAAEWSQQLTPAQQALATEANPFSGQIDPQINPQTTNGIGYYGWNVAQGCWFVTVEHADYQTLVSPVVGVPPEVTDLDLELTPLNGPGPDPDPDPDPVPDPGTGGGGGGGGLEYLTVVKGGTGDGDVTSSPAGIDCGATCTASYVVNTTVRLTARAAEGSTFTGWSGRDCAGTGECVLTMSHSRDDVVAIFDELGEESFELTVTRTGEGRGLVTSSPAGIDCGLECSAEFVEGTTVTLTATPLDGSTFEGWSGSCTGHEECVVTIDDVVSVEASFAAPAVAGKVEAGSRVHLAYVGRTDTLKATVKSPREVCRVDRLVSFKKRRPGKDRVLARRKTGAEGIARLRGIEAPTGTYYAKIHTFGTANESGVEVTCSGDVSDRLKLGDPR